VTSTLYGGDKDMRIRQEIVLGVGGLRALKALGIEPTVCHLNEGHAGLSRRRAHPPGDGAVPRGVCRGQGAGRFQQRVHDPHAGFPAGIDVFPADLVERYFAPCCAQLGLSRDQFMAFGRQNPQTPTSRSPCRAGHPAFRGDQRRERLARARVPAHVVGALAGRAGGRYSHHVHHQRVHVRGWLSQDMAGLFDAYLGPRWVSHPADQSVWERVEQIPTRNSGARNEAAARASGGFARRRLRAQLEQRGAPPAERAQAEEVLDPKALTIGFARRFATYKRATLLFADPGRLSRILSDRTGRCRSSSPAGPSG